MIASSSSAAMTISQISRRRRCCCTRALLAGAIGVASTCDRKGSALAFLRSASSGETLGGGRKAGAALVSRSRGCGASISETSLKNLATRSSAGGIHSRSASPGSGVAGVGAGGAGSAGGGVGNGSGADGWRLEKLPDLLRTLGMRGGVGRSSSFGASGPVADAGGGAVSGVPSLVLGRGAALPAASCGGATDAPS